MTASMRFPVLFLFILALGSLCGARAQTLVADFSSAPAGGVFTFASTTPKSLPELLRGQGEAAQVQGHLFLPPADAAGGRVGAVILVHGSGGLYDAMLGYWPRTFNAAGWAVLALDSFGPRGVASTAEDQSQVPFAADTADAFAALRLLASHPRIDPRRIAVMGFSRGGITAWRSALQRVIASQKLPGGLQFAAHVPVYAGGCAGIFRITPRPGVFSPAPQLWVHGDADDYTPIGPCRDYADRIGQSGVAVTFFAVPGAMHKFDLDDTRRVFIRGAQRTSDTCSIETDIDTLSVFDRNTGQRLSGDALAAALRACAATGAHVQGDRAARDQAAQAIRAFLTQVFAAR